MIDISPHVESARDVSAESSPAGETQGIGGQRSAFGPRRNSGKKPALGVFAAMLAGLSAKTQSARPGSAEVPADGPGVSGLHPHGVSETKKKTALTLKKAAKAPGEEAAPGDLFPGQSAPGKAERGKVRKDRTEGLSSEVAGLTGIPAGLAAVEAGPVDAGKEAPSGLAGPPEGLPRVGGGAETAGASAPAGASAGMPGAVPAGDGARKNGSPAHAAAGEGAGIGLSGSVGEGLLRQAGASAGAARAGVGAARAGVGAARVGEEGEGGSRAGRQGRIVESRKDRKREQAVFEVVDFRNPGRPDASGGTRETVLREGPLFHEADIVVDLGPGGDAAAGEKADSPSAGGGIFENLLARELEQNLSDGIVREARFILRDGGQGSIRLSLKPDVLGNVKIRLEMAENKITGHIIVESEEALRAFEREIHSLEQAFLDSGFDGAALDFSLAQGDGRREEREPLFPGIRIREAASLYEGEERAAESAGGPVTEGMFRRNGRIQVNMLI